MKIDDLCETFHALRFPSLAARAHPDREAVLGARARVGTAVADDTFLADCIAWELRLIEGERLRRGLTPFFTVPDLGIHLALGYWAPGMRPGPHEHTAWTITAVCRNQLEVLTYDREASYQQQSLVPKNCFQAPAGKVGFIYEPCIHDPRNLSDDWSLSLHVISPRDGERPADHPEPLPILDVASGLPEGDDAHPFTHVMIARQRHRYVHQLARVLSTMTVAEAPALLARCFDLGTSATRRLIGRAAREDAARTPWRLARTHDGLVLGHRRRDDMVALDVETPRGPRQAFVTGAAAREAIAFVTKEPSFDVDALPGPLSGDERAALAEALEQTGVFTRARP
ncbi:MAG: hypothetical protein QM820_58290 [Minicystis sp.]